MIKELQWKADAPPGLSYQAHKFSLLDVVEVASMQLKTDYTKEAETIVTGHKGRVVLITLPHMVNDEGNGDYLKAVEGKALLGTIGRRKVFFDGSDDMFQKLVVSNGRESVTIVIPETLPPLAS